MNFWSRIPGQTRGAKCVWLAHLLMLVGFTTYLKSAKPPGKMRYSAQELAGQEHHIADFVQMGLWKGSVIGVVICLLILLLVRWWGHAAVATVDTQMPAPQVSRKWFWPLLIFVCVTAGFMRLPRMSMSYWGDEGWAARFYGHGKFKPAKDQDVQGELVFDPASWRDAAFRDNTGGNHFLFTLSQQVCLRTWRWFTGGTAADFNEAISRIPPFIAGIGSIMFMALLLKWLGRPRAGLLAAVLFAIHPWHIRYSTEARGYSMMLMFVILALWALLKAMQDGRWRWWVAAGSTAFLTVYSWKLGALYYLPLPLSAAAWLLYADAPWQERLNAVSRLFVVLASAGALFTFLFMPALLQSKTTLKGLQNDGKPMNQHWFDDSLCLALTGTPWYRQDPENKTEVPMSERIQEHTFSARVGVIGDVCLIGLGLLLLLKKRPALTLGLAGMLVLAAAGAAYFKWSLRIEWITWYFLPLIFPLMLFKATAMDDLISISAAWVNRLKGSPKMRALACVTALLAMLAPIASAQNAVPQILLMLKQPYESHREAFNLSRGQHEALGYTGTSKIWTVYSWRHIYTYDPRADLYCRSADQLKAKMQKADAADGELYVVVGQRALTQSLSPEMMQLIHDEKLFTKLETFWAEESAHTLEVYKYLHTSSAQP